VTPEHQPRSANAGVLLLVLFAGFEAVQAISEHDATLLLGTWLALTSAAVLAMRFPATRLSLVGRGLLRPAFVAAEVSWGLLAVAAGVVALAAGRPSAWVWALAAVVAALLTPIVVYGAPG